MFYKKYTRTLNPTKQQFFYYFFKDIKNMSRNSWVADIASYNGMNADIFKDHNYVAVDRDLEILKKIVGQKYKVKADILSLPFLTGSLDAVISTHTLSQLKFNERSRAIEELGRLVRPGGSFIFNVPLSDDNGKRVKLEEISQTIDDSFEIQRVVVYGGLLCQFYDSVITGWFRERKGNSLFFSRLYMLLTLTVSFFDLFVGLSRFFSSWAYFCLRKNPSQGTNSRSFSDFFSRLACPTDKSELIRLAEGRYQCRSCARNFAEQGGIIDLSI